MSTPIDPQEADGPNGRLDRPAGRRIPHPAADDTDTSVGNPRTVNNPGAMNNPSAVPDSRTVAAARTAPDVHTDEDNSRALPPDRATVLAREREQFGGMKLGTAFFGWLTATGLAVLLIAILAAAGVSFGVTDTANVDKAVQATNNATGTAKTVGLIGGIVLLVILFIAYYCGGYVAGRMARFNGLKQGLAVWLWAIFTSAIIAAVAAIAGSKYHVLSQLNLPRIPVDEGNVTTAGIIAIAAAILAALLGALLGGLAGMRFHRRVDAAGFDEDR